MQIEIVLINIITKNSLLPENHHIKPHMNVLKLNPLSLSVELAIKQLLALFYSRIAQGRWLFAKMSAIRFRRQKASFAATNLMQEKSDFYDKPCPIRIEIDPEKIQLLLANRQLCAADFHCLDQASHRCIRELCLKTCLHPLGHN
ncbi:hypothetical protein [Methylotuvimicrobium sp. KM2]|uniref:hypothetical protein n=1 Tax=Methylotuvimicrobium sp. KM2 TaxID=3133976 RepID=UPI0031019374